MHYENKSSTVEARLLLNEPKSHDFLGLLTTDQDGWFRLGDQPGVGSFLFRALSATDHCGSHESHASGCLSFLHMIRFSSDLLIHRNCDLWFGRKLVQANS